MGKYNLPPDKLAQIPTTSAPGYQEPHGHSTGTGMTQEQWNNLPEDEQKKLYIQYAGDPGKPTDVKLHRKNTPEDGKWKHEAHDPKGEGYVVHADKLKTLANKMEGELGDWKSTLNKVSSAKFAKGSLGGTEAGNNLEGTSDRAAEGFGDFVQKLEGAYTQVIGKLRAAARAYEQAGDQTHHQVNGVKVTGSGNADL